MADPDGPLSPFAMGRRKTGGRAMQLSIRRLTLAIALLTAFIGTAVAADRPERTADARISLHTLDGDVQQVDVNEIWRVRTASTSDEPPGAVVIDFAFERLYVKDTLDDVVALIRNSHKIEKFTSPSGAPVYILPGKVIGISRPIPSQHHPSTKAIIIAREGQQQVQETRDAVREALGK